MVDHVSVQQIFQAENPSFDDTNAIDLTQRLISNTLQLLPKQNC